jgi:pimeloyl-ACP methyl ester carboxylesterase
MSIRRAFADLSVGQVHYAECGDAHAPAVLLLHQSPRSWAEYRAVLPLIGAHRRAIAMDTAGFGDSADGGVPASIEQWARVACELLDALNIGQADVVGHHTGGVVAVELAAAFPDRIRSLVLSSTPSPTNRSDARVRNARPSTRSRPAKTVPIWLRCGRSARASIRRGVPSCSRPSCAMR